MHSSETWKKAPINSQKACSVCPCSAHCKRLTDLRRKKAQTFTGSASTSLHVACSSAASASQLKWPHQERFKTLFAAVNVSTLSAASVNEWAGLTGVHVGNALQSSRCAPVLTDWDVRRRERSLFGTKPSLPLFYSPPVTPSFYVTLSLVSFHFIPSCCPRLALSPRTKWIPSASSCLPSVLMPVIVRFQQECERGRDRETDTAWSKTSVSVFIWDSGSLCFEGSTNPHPLWNKQLLACTGEGSSTSMRTGRWEGKTWRGSFILSMCVRLVDV